MRHLKTVWLTVTISQKSSTWVNASLPLRQSNHIPRDSGQSSTNRNCVSADSEISFIFVLLTSNCFFVFFKPQLSFMPSVLHYSNRNEKFFTRSLTHCNGSQDILQSGGRWWLNEWVTHRSAFSTACWGGLHQIMCCAAVCVYVCVCVWTSVQMHVFQCWWT